MNSVDPQTFGRLMVRLEDEISRSSRISILLRLTGKPAVAENNGTSASNFWAYLQAIGAFSRENPDPNIFEGFPVVQRMIREVCWIPSPSPSPSTTTTRSHSVELEELISQEVVWNGVGTRLSEIQLELDSELLKANRPRSAAWFYRVTSAKAGPKGQTKVLFSEAKEQMCLPHLMRAISKVSPLIGQFLNQSPLAIEKGQVSSTVQISTVEKEEEGRRQTTMNPFVESMEVQYQTKTMLASTLLSQCTDVPLKKHVTRLMLALGEDDSWLKFAKAKGATR